MVRDVEVVDAVVSGLSTLHYFVFRCTPNTTEPTHRHKRSYALKLCTFFFLSLGRSWPSAAATAAPTNTMGTWQSQATHSTQLTQNTADITLHRLFALRHCKLLLRAATPCGLGPTGHMTPSRTHCSHIPSAQTQAGARAHVLLRRTPVASEGYRDSASNSLAGARRGMGLFGRSPALGAPLGRR